MTDKTKPSIIKVPTVQLIFVRDGERIMPPVGKGYRFTQDEIDEITKVNDEALRDPRNESNDAPTIDAESEADEADQAAADAAAAKKKADAAKAKAAASKTDDEGL